MSGSYSRIRRFFVSLPLSRLVRTDSVAVPSACSSSLFEVPDLADKAEPYPFSDRGTARTREGV
jgi:hypothetical protein